MPAAPVTAQISFASALLAANDAARAGRPAARHAPRVIALPDVDTSPERAHAGSMRLRYEDVAQDGRVKLEMIPASLGAVLWRGRLARSEAMAALRREEIVPVLRRFVIVGTDALLSVHRPVEAEGRWEPAHARGERTRFLWNMRVDLHAPRDTTYGAPPDRAGALERIGGVYAEHVLTRPFAPKGQRRVEQLPEGLEAGRARPWVPDEALLETDAERVDPEPAPAGEIRFALAHTDSNRHVNSLVYPRLFEERAIDAWGDGGQLMRAIDIAWRKPCFADEVAAVHVQRIRTGDRRGALATLRGLAPNGTLEERPRCVATLWLG